MTTTDAIFTDTSYFQNHVDDSYPHQWVSFRICDGTFRDPAWVANYGWAKKKAYTGHLAGYIGYCVYRPGADVFGTIKSMVGTPDKHLVVMVDVESWGGQIRGDHSGQITALADRLAGWLGDRRRVLVYANGGDFANLYPTRPDWLKLVLASYGSVKPSLHNMIGWQYSDGQSQWPVPAGLPRSSPPFGHCDHNVFPGLTADQAAAALGVGKQTPTDWFTMATEKDLEKAVLAVLNSNPGQQAIQHAVMNSPVDSWEVPGADKTPLYRFIQAIDSHAKRIAAKVGA